MICRESLLEVGQELLVSLWVSVHCLDHLVVHLSIVHFDTINKGISVPVGEDAATSSSAFAVLEFETLFLHFLRLLCNGFKGFLLNSFYRCF